MNHYVYLTTNLVNGKRYIGKRSCSCLIEEDLYLGSGKILIKAIDQYGLENFSKEILKICSTEDEAYRYEAEMISKYNAKERRDFYNLDGGGRGTGIGKNNPFYGKQHTLETRKRISSKVDFKREKNPMFGVRLVGKDNGMFGKKQSEISRIKISERTKGRIAYNKGVSRTEEEKRNISIAVKESMKNVLHEHICKTCGTSFKSNAARSYHCDKCREQAKEKLEKKLTKRCVSCGKEFRTQGRGWNRKKCYDC